MLQSVGFWLGAILYVFLAGVATAAAAAERAAGRDRFCHHYRIEALIYALLGVAHLLHS